MTSAPEYPRLHDAGMRVDSMPPAGRDLHLVVGAEEREAVAAALGISAVESLTADLHAARFRGGMRITGRLLATIVQPSVVTLEPVRQQVEEPVDRVFLPGREKPFAESAGAEIFVDLEGEDIPDYFEGPEADLSGLVVETLALAIDPYPRAADESLEDLDPSTDDAAEESPFSRLKSLRNSTDED